MGGVKETVQIMVDTKAEQDKAEEKYDGDAAKKKEAKKKIEEQGARTAQLHAESTVAEIKLLDETYEEKYGEVIDAHKATKNYLKANGKVIGTYNKDMAVIKEQMKNAKVLGFDEEWQKAAVLKVKEKNKKAVEKLNDKRAKADQDLEQADEQKEANEAIEKAVPEYKKLQPAMSKLDKATAKIFFTEDEIANLGKPKEDIKTESVNEEEEEAKEKVYVKDLSRLTRNIKLGAELDELPTDLAKKTRIKKALQEFESGLEDYNEANIIVSTIKQKTGAAIEKMDETERPKGSSGMMEWKDIDLKKLEEETELEKTVRTKIGMTEQEDTKPSDILKIAAAEPVNVDKLKNEIKDLEATKSKYQEEIKALQGDEETDPVNNEKEILEIKEDVKGLKLQKQNYQKEIEQLQAA